MANNYDKVENIKRPLKLGEKFMVTCLVKREQDKIIAFTPVIDRPHTDLENGQPEVHYHADYRFILTEETKSNSEGFIVIDERDGFKLSKPRVEKGIDGEIEYHILPVVSEEHNGLAQQLFIRNSKLKHKCIHKGKCPHRGYDLSQEKAVDGIITCPLHSLKFDAKTGKITDEVLDALSRYQNSEHEYKKRVKQFYAKINTIKDGDTITLKRYEELMKIFAPIYSTYIKGSDENFECEIKITMTDEYMPKPLENGRVYKFKVKR